MIKCEFGVGAGGLTRGPVWRCNGSGDGGGRRGIKLPKVLVDVSSGMDASTSDGVSAVRYIALTCDGF